MKTNPAIPSIQILPSWACRFVAVVIACFTTMVQAASAAVRDEAFDYTVGTDIAGQSGGAGWSGAWSTKAGNGAITEEAGSLTWPGIVSTGGKMSFIGIPATGTSTNTLRTLATPLSEGTTHYIRCLAQNLNEGRRFFGVALYNTAEQMLLGQASTASTWTINHIPSLPSNVLDSTVDSSAVALLVLKLELLPGVERVTFWVNPDLSQAESVTTAVGGTSYLTDSDFVSVTRIRIGGGGYSSFSGGDPTNHYLDEINISDVSPFSDPFTVWINSFGIVNAADRAKDADPDHDGIVNGQEFYLDTNPTIHNVALTPLAGGNLRLVFKRRDDAENLNIVLEASPTLAPLSWTTIQNGVNGAVINVTENGAAADDVEVLIPAPAEARDFVRFRWTIN